MGSKHFFLFGLTVEQLIQLKAGGYNPRQLNPVLKETIDRIASGALSPGNRNQFLPIVNSLLNQDTYLVLADFQAYLECQHKADKAFRDQEHWTRMSILNVARMGKFSSDHNTRVLQENLGRQTD